MWLLSLALGFHGWLLEGRKLCISLHSLIVIAVLKAPIRVGGAGAGAPLEVSLNRLAVFVKIRVAFLCPMSALATVQTILKGKLVITFSPFPCG